MIITVSDTDPTAAFSGTPTSGPEPLTVAFTDNSTSYDGIVSWLWDFGDGQTSVEQNPSHQYAQAGMYTVILTVTEADSDSDRETKMDYIAVTQPAPGINAIRPSSGTQGQTLDVVISGTHFDGAEAVGFGPGITVGSFSVWKSTRIIATIVIGNDAAVGGRDVSVTTPGGTATVVAGFLVKQAPPTIVSVIPDRGALGYTLDVIISGAHFTGATAVSFGSKITVNGFSVNGDTQNTANITIAAKASTGTRDVKVSASVGTATLSKGILVTRTLTEAAEGDSASSAGTATTALLALPSFGGLVWLTSRRRLGARPK